MNETLLEVDDLQVHFSLPSKTLFGKGDTVKAVDGVSFALKPGETLGVVGESGCGKSTLGRGILQLVAPTGGRVCWMGQNIAGYSARDMRRLRKDLQIIFQDPLASLDPRMTIGQIIAQPLQVHEPVLNKQEVEQRVRQMMDRVGLLPRMINRYPHEFSGGQCQRIGIARAMILKPKVIICDEPVSALDVSIQAQIINLLQDLQQEFGLSLVFISHDLSIVRHISHRIMVLYLGRIMELADRDSLYAQPLHPYSQALISSVPVPDPIKERAKKRIDLEGDLPSPINPPSGCVFRTRCPVADEGCAKTRPELEQASTGHEVSCLRWRDVSG